MHPEPVGPPVPLVPRIREQRISRPKPGWDLEAASKYIGRWAPRSQGLPRRDSVPTYRARQERKTLQAMIRIYCRGTHGGKDALCPACSTLEAYALGRLDKCPFGADKPKCSACPIHCYKPAMREQIKEVMRYAGPRMLPRHPKMAIQHLADGIVHRPKATS